jgi:hypothetical protein
MYSRAWLLIFPDHPSIGFKWASCCSMFSFLCSFMSTIVFWSLYRLFFNLHLITSVPVTFVFWEIENVQFINNLYGIGMYGEQCSTTWSKTHLFVITGLKLLYFIIPCDCNFVEVLNKMISVLFMKYWTVSAVIRYVDLFPFAGLLFVALRRRNMKKNNPPRIISI